MDEVIRAIKGLKDGENTQWRRNSSMDTRGSQFVHQTTPMDHQNRGGRPCTTSLEGCQHSHHLQKNETEQNAVITEVYHFFLQPASSLLGSY